MEVIAKVDVGFESGAIFLQSMSFICDPTLNTKIGIAYINPAVMGSAFTKYPPNQVDVDSDRGTCMESRS